MNTHRAAAEDGEDGIPGGGSAGGGPWWARPMLVSVTALATMAVLTLATIGQAPWAKARAGSGADSEPAARATSTASSRAGAMAGGGSRTTTPAGPAPSPSASGSASPSATPSATPAATASAGPKAVRALRRAVTALPGSGTGDLAVAVAVGDGDGGGSVAAYDSAAGDDVFDTASIVKVDILAALLLDHQRAGTRLTANQRSLATAMIEQSDNDAALALWHTIGGAAGLDAANTTLGLDHTSGGPGELWGLTQTTAADQIALLRAVFGGEESPLSAASRAYVAGLMESVTAGQQWGVSAADTGGSGGYALKNGWLRRTATGLWDINSIGEVTYGEHRLLISVLSSGQRSEAAGIELVEGAAQAAARAFAGAAGWVPDGG
jgi:Beta-lactamase enzyme family